MITNIKIFDNKQNPFLDMIWLHLFILSAASINHVFGILSGHLAGLWNVTYLVSIRKVDEDLVHYGMGHICGGAVIGDYTVLTAATCVTEAPLYSQVLDPHKIRIVGGNTNRTTETVLSFLSYVERIELHPNFRPLSGANNLALIFFNKRLFSVQDTFKPIPLAREPLPENATVTIAGWGAEIDEAGEYTECAKMLKVQWINATQCGIFNPSVPDRTMCLYSEKPKVGPCRGDYGGPVVYNGTLVAIMQLPRVLEFEVCGLNVNPTVCTEVQYYADWIIRTTVESFAMMLIVTWDMLLSFLAIVYYVENLILLDLVD